MDSKLIKALTKVSDVLETWCDHLPPIIQDEAKKALALADKALAAPARNCDRQFRNAHDVLSRFTAETGRQIFNTTDVINWLLAEAKGEAK